MTGRQQKIESIIESMCFYVAELASMASDLEELNLNQDGDDLRSVASDLEQIMHRIYSRRHRRKQQ